MTPDPTHDPRESDEDRRLAQLLASVRAEADPAVWVRARARLAAAPAPALTPSFVDAVVEWLTRPIAMAAATAALVVALGAGWQLAGTIVESESSAVVADAELQGTDASSLMESLLESSSAESDDPGGEEMPLEAPQDSGGRS